MKKRFLTICLVVFMLVVPVSCPTPHSHLDSINVNELVEQTLNGRVIAVMEAEDGIFVNSPFWSSGQDRPTIFRNSGQASGGAYVKAGGPYCLFDLYI